MRSFSTIKGNALVNKFRDKDYTFHYSTVSHVGDHPKEMKSSKTGIGNGSGASTPLGSAAVGTTSDYTGIGDDRKFSGSFIDDSVSGQNRRRRVEANERIKVIGRFSLALFALGIIMIVCIFSEEHHGNGKGLFSSSSSSIEENIQGSLGHWKVGDGDDTPEMPITVTYDYVELYGPPAVNYEWMKGRFIIEPYRQAVVNYTEANYDPTTQKVEWTVYQLTSGSEETEEEGKEKDTVQSSKKDQRQLEEEPMIIRNHLDLEHVKEESEGEAKVERTTGEKQRQQQHRRLSTRGDTTEILAQGTGSTFTITGTDPYASYSLEIKVVDTESGVALKWFTYEDIFVCKYVRRELRMLTDADVQDLYDAMYVLWSTPLEEGKELYGDSYVDIIALTVIHQEYAGDITCDHMHDGMGFLTHHSALGRMFEASIQLVNPAVCLPYWDYTIDTQRASNSTDYTVFLTDSDIFDANSLGDYDVESHVVNSGRWANYALYNNANTYTSVFNSYNYLRSPWNANSVPYLTRNYKSNGQAVEDLPSCFDHYTLLQQEDFSSFAQSIAYKPHGKVHVILGGIWDADFNIFQSDNSLTEEAGKQLTVEAAAIQKNLWRAGIYTCPTDCSPEETCACSCPSVELWETTLTDVSDQQLAATNLLTKYWSVTNDHPEYLYDTDGNLKAHEILKFVCNSYDYTNPKTGEMYTSSAPLDPAFWITHPTVERLYSWRSINGFDSMSWATNSSITSSTGYCYGHEENDVLKYTNLVEGDEGVEYTNRDILDLLDPSTGSNLPYVFDSFTWEHCLLDGLSDDLMSQYDQ